MAHFVEFLRKHLPPGKQTYTEKLVGIGPLELEAQFRLKVIPAWRLGMIGSVVRVILETADVKVQELGTTSAQRSEFLRMLRDFLVAFCKLFTARTP